MAGSLRDELASLKIDRGPRDSGPKSNGRAPGRRGDGGLGLLALVLWLIPLGLLAFAGTYAYNQYEQIRAKVEVNVGLVQTMTPGEAEKLLSAKGYLKSRYQAMIGAKIPGRVERMFVEEGDEVKKGDVLAVLEHDELKASLASRVAMVSKTEAELMEARVELKLKEREAIRALRLANQRSVSAEEAEKAEAARGMAEARLKGLEASLELQRANVREVEETIRNMSLYAPFDGTVVQKEGEEGEIITPSAFSAATGRSSVVTLASLDQMDVETDVAESLLSRIAIGQPAEISVSAVPDKHYRGKLRQIIPMGDRSRGTIKVNVEILDPDEKLFPELVATVHFLPDQALDNPNANKAFLFVPKSAVFEESGHSFVWVLGPKSRLAKRKVEVATTNDDLARVESGLTSGETVVLSPPKTLKEDEVVTVAQ
ncbi:MAG: efflux RND transporter periplasmic adaptor subunit [Isosphaeraceae bacterium]